MSYHIQWEPRGALKKLTGFVTGREFRDSIDDLCMDERFAGIDWLICDLTGVTAHSIDRQDVIDVVAMSHGSKQINPRLSVHIVATDPDLINLLQLANDPDLNNPYRSSAYTTPNTNSSLAARRNNASIDVRHSTEVARPLDYN